MSSEKQFPADKFYDLTATINVAATESEVLDLSGLELAGVFVPYNFDGTTLTLKAATSSTGTFVPVTDASGATYTLTTAPSKYAAISNLAITAGLRFIKLVAGTAQATDATVFTLSLRAV